MQNNNYYQFPPAASLNRAEMLRERKVLIEMRRFLCDEVDCSPTVMQLLQVLDRRWLDLDAAAAAHGMKELPKGRYPCDVDTPHEEIESESAGVGGEGTA